MVIEKVHGLQNTTISLSERFTLMTAEYLRRITRPRKRASFGSYQKPMFRWFVPNQMTLRMQQTLRQAPVRARLGMPGLRRFGSEGNLPGLQRSNSVDGINQFRDKIPWRQSNGNLSRASSVSNLSRASWHGRGGVTRVARRPGHVGGRMRAVGWRQAARQPAGRARGRGRARGGVNRSQQYRLQQNNNQQNENQQNNNQNNRKPNQPFKKLPTKEELDAQLDEYMATSQVALDKELDEYMLKGALMDVV